MKRLSVQLCAIVLLASCQTGGKGAFQSANSANVLSEGGAKVKIIRGNVPKGCKEVDEITAGANLGTKQKKIYLRNRAAKSGGNAILLEEQNIIRTTATVYKCS